MLINTKFALSITLANNQQNTKAFSVLQKEQTC